MKANELRIGNWLYSNLTKQDFQVNAGDIESINGDPSVCDPIPITVEWLLKSGFEKSKIFDYFTLNDIISFSKDLKTCYILGDNILKREIKYQHEVQNLHFALIGEELEI